MSLTNGKIEFSYIMADGASVRMTISDETPLPQVLEAFEMFLRASGYAVDGIVDIVQYADQDMVDPNAEAN